MKQTAVMDDGWTEEIKKATSSAKKKAAKVKQTAKADPKKKKAAIETAIKSAEANFKKKK